MQLKIVLESCLICPPKEGVPLVKMLTYATKNRYTLSEFLDLDLAKNDVSTKSGMNGNGLI